VSSLHDLVMQAHPGIIAASMPWLNGLDYKRLCSWMPYIATVLVLTRDRGEGQVTIGKDGLPRVHYWPDKQDRQSMMNVRPLLPCKCCAAEHHDWHSEP